jgi:protease I
MDVPEVLMVIAPEQFRDEEYERPKEVLEARGARIVTASVAPGPCRGKLGMIAQADVAVFDVDPSGYDAVVFVGGGGSSVFFDDLDAHRIAKATFEAGDILGAICIAPSTLAHAGLLEGRRATAFPSQEQDLEAHGAKYTGTPVEVDGTIITASGPEPATAFGEALADAMGI